MAVNGSEPIVSMGADEPLAVLSKTHPGLFDYFRQRFAQVTNPPMDALREEVKTDCSVYIGDDGNLLSREADNCRVLELPSPVLTEEELERIRGLIHPAFRVRTVPCSIRRKKACGMPWTASLPPATGPAGRGQYPDPLRPGRGRGSIWPFPRCWRCPRWSST